MLRGEAVKIQSEPITEKPCWFVLFDSKARAPRGYVYTERAEAEQAAERYLAREQRKLNVVPVLPISLRDLGE